MWIRHSCHGYQPSSLCSHTTAYPARARTSNLPRRSDRSRQQVHYLRAQAGPPDELCLPAIQDASAAQRQGQWLAGHIQLWADEEWTELDVHAELAQRTAEAYAELRLEGENELGSLVLSLSDRLQNFEFRDTFTSNFEVANKVIELLMAKEGREVCCRSQADEERYARGEVDFAAASSEL